jgi:hypothetical protein
MILLYPRWLPESSRWLLLHGKAQQAVQNLQKVAMMNGRKAEGERLTTEVSGCGWKAGLGFCGTDRRGRCGRGLPSAAGWTGAPQGLTCQPAQLEG